MEIFLLYYIFYVFISEWFCPKDYYYQQGELHGELLGGGILLSLEDCALACKKDMQCQSFEHNVFVNHCYLHSAPHPNAPQEKETVFCSKQGKILESL